MDIVNLRTHGYVFLSLLDISSGVGLLGQNGSSLFNFLRN